MTKNEIEIYVKHKADVVEQVLVWLVRDIAIYHCHNSTNYLTKLKSIHDRAVGPSGKKTGNYALKEFSTLFHFDEKFIELICGGKPRVEGQQTRLVKQILSLVRMNSDVLHYIGKKNATYKSGKKFSHHGWWMIDTRKAEALFADEAWDNLSSDRCSDEARYVISKIAFYYAKLKLHRYNLTLKKLNIITKDKTMTKAEKEKLKEECDQGLHGLPYDYLVKHIEKEEKTKLKTLQTRIRKMTQKAMIEMQIELEKKDARISELEAENEHLRSLKDLNSDIPEEAPVHKLSYEEFAEQYPDGVDPETFDFSILSDECKAKCQAMYDKQMKTNTDLIPHDKLESIRKQLALLGEDDIPDIETETRKAPQELAEKKVVETPADDIPAPTEEELSKLERQINRLQEFVNKLYISVNEARAIAEFFGRGIELKEARSGFSAQDAQTHKKERGMIFNYFKNELEAKQLVTDQASKFFRYKV